MPEPADRPPSLRERLAEALRKAAYVCPGDGCPHDENTCGVGEPIVLAAATSIDGEPEGTLIDGEVTAIADAVLPVVEAAMLAIEVDATQRADELAARLEQALDQIATERRGKLAAEAAVRRAQALADRWSAALGVDIAHARALREALNAEQAERELPPVEHVRGANAEDCPACAGRRDLPYPFICPGTDPAAPDGEGPVPDQCRTCESYILPDGIGWRHVLGPADHTPEPAPDAEETR